MGGWKRLTTNNAMLFPSVNTLNEPLSRLILFFTASYTSSSSTKKKKKHTIIVMSRRVAEKFSLKPNTPVLVSGCNFFHTGSQAFTFPTVKRVMSSIISFDRNSHAHTLTYHWNLCHAEVSQQNLVSYLEPESGTPHK